MISRSELRTVARARLRDAAVLLDGGRYAGAVYLCGYAVEMMLKASACRALKWSEFPMTKGEFQPYRSFQTHNLDTLLHLSGAEQRIKERHFAEWSAVATWEPAARYRAGSKATHADAKAMVVATTTLLKAL